MDKPSLSIILIARENTSILLRRAIESALRQKGVEVELTIVDANEPGSVHSRGLAEDASRYPTVSVIAPAGVRTEASLRNRALAQARGEYVAFLGVRDEWAPGKAAAQIARMAGGEAACCVNGLIQFDKLGSLTSDLLFEDAGKPARWLTMRPMRMGSQMLYRTSALRAIGGFDEHLSALCDLDAALRLQDQGGVAVLPEPLFTARADQSTLPEEYADGRRLLRKYEDALLLDRKLSSGYYALLARQAAHLYLWLDAASYFILSVLRSPLRSALGWGKALIRAGYFAARCAYWEIRARMKRTSHRAAGEGIAFPPVSARTFARYPAYRFAGNRKIGAYAVPERATKIARGMFLNCALRIVALPRSLTQIGARAFQGCAYLERVELADGSGLSEIGDYAFAGCAVLTAIRLPQTIRHIGKGAFLGCVNLSRIEFGEGTALPAAIAELPPDAFANCPSLTEIAFADGSMLTRIGRGAFRGCRGLIQVKITGAVNAIGAYAFQDCSALSKFEMPLIDAVREIGPCAFENCANLPEVHVPDAICRIRSGTYRGCVAITRVKIPVGVKRIGRGAFRGCQSLKVATIGNPDAVIARSAVPAGTQLHKLGPVEDG